MLQYFLIKVILRIKLNIFCELYSRDLVIALSSSKYKTNYIILYEI